MGRHLPANFRGLGAIGLFDWKQEHLLPRGFNSTALGLYYDPGIAKL